MAEESWQIAIRWLERQGPSVIQQDKRRESETSGTESEDEEGQGEEGQLLRQDVGDEEKTNQCQDPKRSKLQDQ